MSARKASRAKAWIHQLSLLEDESARRQFLARHSGKKLPELVDCIYEETVNLIHKDLRGAHRVAQASEWLAKKLDDDYARAQSLRAMGHVLFPIGRYRASVKKYQGAFQIFERLGRELDAARAMMNQLQPLIYLGQYDEAFAIAEKARAIFSKHADRIRLARLNSNVGNIFYRQDRFGEALELYRRAYKVLIKQGSIEDIAVVLYNIAVCYISLNRFDLALKTYRNARHHSKKHDLPLLVARVDYNIAYLHYLRGEYAKAIELYQSTRAWCQKIPDPYHTALCDLDLSELYLELNLSDEGADLAKRAYIGFRHLGMGYEAAKALAFEAISLSQEGNAEEALKEFGCARGLFVREMNQRWPALIDFYTALVLFDSHDYRKSRRLCKSALAFFRKSSSFRKSALCELLLARLDLQTKKPQGALSHCSSAIRLLAEAEAPAIDLQACVIQGQVQEALGNRDAAYKSFQRAHRNLEGLRSHLFGEEFKISFLTDKLSVFEGLMCLSLSHYPGNRGRKLAFDFIEQAKSRSLADLISLGLHALEPKSKQKRKLAKQMRDLKERSTLAYRQAQHEESEFSQVRVPTDRALKLRQRRRAYERQFANTVTRLASVDQDYISLVNAGTVPLDRIRSAIPEGSLLIEYYQARGIIYGCLVGKDLLDIVPLAPVGCVLAAFRLLQFRLSRFCLGAEYIRHFAEVLRAATLAYLQELYSYLIAPLRPRLKAAHLIVVPHGFLHYLPFHALADGNQYLLDEFSVSYAPSASVYCLCAERKTVLHQNSLVLGIPDPLAPQILDEARTVAAALPNARLFLGKRVTRELLWRYASTSRYVHIATHVLFRHDNPMFSSIRLGDSELNLFDLYQLRLSSELVTLSGCGTGLNAVVGGDELLGLVRGLLYAGARAALVTLWDVDDESTAEFMQVFYEQLQKTPNKAAAMQYAAKHVRQLHPHPYYWAPFVFVGKFQQA